MSLPNHVFRRVPWIFPARERAKASLAELERAARSCLFPEEPTSRQARLPRLNPVDFQGRTWANRKGLWVDLLAEGGRLLDDLYTALAALGEEH